MENNILKLNKFKGKIMEFIIAINESDFKKISKMSDVIWHIAYKNILDEEQIIYMLDKFLSINAIKENINSGYKYILLEENDTFMGFFAYEFKDDYIFLSKLYILPEFQNIGLARASINYLKNYRLPIRLTVNKFNENAVVKYEKMGFKKIDSIVTDIGSSYVMDDYVYELKN